MPRRCCRGALGHHRAAWPGITARLVGRPVFIAKSVVAPIAEGAAEPHAEHIPHGDTEFTAESDGRSVLRTQLSVERTVKRTADPGTQCALKHASGTATAAPPPPPGKQTDCAGNQNGGANNHVTELDNNTYHLQANEWNSNANFTVCTDGNADFTISSSGIDVPHNGAPGAYPSLYKGCHWGNCTSNSGMPVAVSAMAGTANKVTTSYDTTTVNNGAWDDSYDIWYNAARSTNSNNSGLEMMIWLSHIGGTQPAGSPGPTVTLDGISWTVWYGGSGNGGTVSFVANNAVSSVNNLDLGPLAAIRCRRATCRIRGSSSTSRAGFEPWTSGQGLTANSFNVSVN